MQDSKKKLILKILVPVIVVIVSVVGYFISKRMNDEIIINASSNGRGDVKDSVLGDVYSKAPVGRILGSGGIEKLDGLLVSDEIKVYVVGCVKHPGIVKLKKGQIIDDAINAAGGATASADLENINLVYELKENIMLRIKSKSERNSDSKLQVMNSGVEIVKDSKNTVVNESSSKDKKDGKININNASENELDTLPGVGKSTAQKIINYRSKTGNFKVKEDIMKVGGIGKSKFDGIKDLISVD